jgi:hypothetical protein
MVIGDALVSRQASGAAYLVREGREEGGNGEMGRSLSSREAVSIFLLSTPYD